MCITFFHIPKNDSKIPFFVFFNRDESGLRLTDNLNYWEEDPNILGGRDNALKGTWFGVNKKTFHIAFLTNLDDDNIKLNPFRLGMLSRGKVISNFLCSDFYNNNTVENFIEDLLVNSDKYNPFNLVLGNLKNQDLIFVDIYHKKTIKFDKGQIYGFSNNLMKFSKWEKVEDGLRKIKKIKNEIDANKPEVILNIMNCIDNYGVLDKTEESSIFIDPFFSDKRCKIKLTVSTTMLFIQNKEVFFYEYQNKIDFSKLKKEILGDQKKKKLKDYVKFIMTLRKMKHFEMQKTNSFEKFTLK